MSTLERVRAALGEGSFEELTARDEMPFINIERDSLFDAMRQLKEQCGFDTNTFVTAIDRHPREPRFEVHYQFLSTEHNDRIRVRTIADSDDPVVPSITALWPGANYSERECFDMFGVRFDGHPNLERLLMPEGYDHFPLRKEFPHRGIEPDRLYREWEAARLEREGQSK